jgi:DNA-binding LacI/PurR family transcriptional regulator
LAQHLVALGHRRIGIINGPESNLAMQARWHGYERALLDAGITPDLNLVVHGDFTSPSGYKAAESLMGRADKPTAIFAFNDSMAMGAIRWLNEHNYDVPDDISVGGFDDTPSAENFNPPLTTVHQYSYDLGQRAADVLIDLIDGQPPHTTEIILPSYLVVRRSTAVLKS